jgi:type VI protein secretion system component Hcp
MRREHDRALKETERNDDGRRPEVPGPAADVLALQRTAGNRAVGDLLARQPKPTAPKEKPKAPAPAASGNRVVFPGIGTIPIESIQLSGGRTAPGTGSGSDREAPPSSTSDVVITSLQGDHSPALFRASLDGKGANVEIILEHGKETVVIELTNAIVSNYSVSGAGGTPVESWTLNFTGIKFRRQGEAAEEPPGSGRDWSFE